MPSYAVDRSSDPPGLDLSFVIVFVLCALAASALLFFFSQRSPEVTATDFDFPPIEVDRDRLESERAARVERASLEEAVEPLERLHGLVRRLNRLQLGERDAIDEPPQRFSMRVQIVADEVVTHTGAEGFVAAGRPIYEQCDRGLDEVMEAVQSGALPIDETSPDALPARFTDYRAGCGDVFGMLRTRGLVTDEGRWSDPELDPVIFGVLQRYRWAHMIGHKRPARYLLTPYEWRLLMRWRIEDPDAYDMSRRRAYVRDARESLPDYNAARAAALLDYEEGDLRGALEGFEKLATEHPEREIYAARVAWLRQKLDAGGPQSAAENATTDTTEAPAMTPAPGSDDGEGDSPEIR